MIAEKEMAKTTPRAAMIAPETRAAEEGGGGHRGVRGMGRVYGGFPAYGKRMESVWNPYGT